MKTIHYSLATLLLLSILLPRMADAQAPPPISDPNVNFAFQAGVLFPSTLFRVRTAEFVSDGVTFSILPKTGIQVGGMATFRLNRRFQVQGGLMLLRRNFDISASNNTEIRNITLRTTVYEVPILMHYYQRLSTNVLLTVGTGISIQTLPSDLGSNIGIISVFAQRRYFAQPGSITTAGVEVRLPKGGGVFLGATYSVVPTPLYTAVVETSFDGRTALLTLPLLGDYFAVVARYYFD